MLSIANPERYYQVFLSQGIGMGIGAHQVLLGERSALSRYIGAGFVYIPSIAVQSHHWGRLRPLAMGIEFTGIRRFIHVNTPLTGYEQVHHAEALSFLS